MTVQLEVLQAELAACDPKDRMAFLKGHLSAIKDPAEKAQVTALLGIFGFVTHKKRHVILLIHGIRTNAEWQEELRTMLEEVPGVIAIPIGYEYFDGFKFWFPLTRKEPIDRVLRHIRTAIGEYKEDDISVVAHSFGTYIISKILSVESGIQLFRLLLCGSIVPTKYKWDSVVNLPKRQSFLNDVGWKDVWPIMARASTIGFGTSGSFGFKCPSVTDRFHNFGHSDFFDPEFMRKFWLPFLHSGEIVVADKKRTPRGYLVVALSWFPLKSVLAGLILFVIYQKYGVAIRTFLASAVAP